MISYQNGVPIYTYAQYNGLNDVVLIDSIGTVLCSNQKVFLYLSEKCHCNELQDILGNLTNNSSVDIKDNKLSLSSLFVLVKLNNISIIGHNDLNVNCVNMGGLSTDNCENVMIKGTTWIGCGSIYNKWSAIDLGTSFNIII